MSVINQWEDALRGLEHLARDLNDSLPSRTARVLLDPIGAVSRMVHPSKGYTRVPDRVSPLQVVTEEMKRQAAVDEWNRYNQEAFDAFARKVDPDNNPPADDPWMDIGDGVSVEMVHQPRTTTTDNPFDDPVVDNDGTQYHNFTKRSLLTIPASMYAYYQIPGIGKPEDRSDEYILVPSNMTY